MFARLDLSHEFCIVIRYRSKEFCMKTIALATIIALSGSFAYAAPEAKATEFKFVFSEPKAKPFSIKMKAATKEDAFKLAAKECFQKLTGGKYPGEERGLDIIDVCANPKM